MPKNYYIVLGIPSDSSQGDIKAAYRRLAKKFHPDRYGKGQSPFQVIQEAYSVLGNPKARESYDLALKPTAKSYASTNMASKSSYSSVEVEPLIPESEVVRSQVTTMDRSLFHQWSIFDDVFEEFLSGFAEHRQPGMKKSEDVVIEVSLSPMQAHYGGNVRLHLPVQMHCPSCYDFSRPGYNCWRCYGTAIVQGEKPVYISYPPGISNNHTIKVGFNDIGDQQLYLNVIFKIQ